MNLLLCTVVGVLAATSASAHGALPGGGGFYAGAAHPFLASEHFLLLIALGLLLGRPQQRLPQVPLVGLALALAAGLAVGASGWGWSLLPLGVLSGAALVSAVLVLALPLPVGARTALSAGAGLLIGLDTGVPVPAEGAEAAMHLSYAGVSVGVFLIVLNVMALASLARRPPYTIAVRVAGSWITAVAVMVLALQLRRLGGAL